MKYLILAILGLLVVASIGNVLSQPDLRTDKPVIYWVTDANPARREQVRLFGDWLSKNGYPQIDLRLDMANADRTKKIIQGVSGVAGDVMDQGSGGDMRYFREIGLNADVTRWAQDLGFDPSKTYRSVETEITITDEDGVRRQYQFPCNVHAPLYFVNREAFRQYGLQPPPMRWTVEEFERIGRQFVQAANKGRRKPTVFLIDNLPVEVLRASYGGSAFNETGTACTLDDEAGILSLRKLYQWTHEDRLLPTAADRSSFTVESGYGGANAQLFNNNFQPERGQYAMSWTGRHLVIEYRKYDAERKRRGQPVLDLGVAECPHGGFPNTTTSARSAMIYAGGKNKDYAKYFLAFLASEEYNTQIVKDGDALPPNPRYTESEAYLRPADHPNEWDAHAGFAYAAKELAIGNSYSPFVLDVVADRAETDAREKMLNHLLTPEAAAREMTDVINAEIARTLSEKPSLLPRYEQLKARQAKIDERKAQIRRLESQGKPIPDELKIPLEWIENPFHRAYYKHKGWVHADVR